MASKSRGTSRIGSVSIARSVALCAAVLAFAVAGVANATAADALVKGSANYKPFAVGKIKTALDGARQLRADVKANDVKGAQAAWIKSREGWEAAEPITGEFFPKLDDAIDAWPDAKHGYHAVEAALFAGKLNEIAQPVDELVANLAAFDKGLNAPGFKFTPQGLLNGATSLAYEVGENKSKGGESPYAGTSLIDMRQNVEGIKAVYKTVFEGPLKAKDAKLAGQIDDKIEAVQGLLKAKDLKSLDAPTLTKTSEELAVLLQGSAAKLGLNKPKLGE